MINFKELDKLPLEKQKEICSWYVNFFVYEYCPFDLKREYKKMKKRLDKLNNL